MSEPMSSSKVRSEERIRFHIISAIWNSTKVVAAYLDHEVVHSRFSLRHNTRINSHLRVLSTFCIGK